MIVTKDMFDEWRGSPVAQWFFKQVERELRFQALDNKLIDPNLRTVEQLAINHAVQYGYVKGMLSVGSLTYEELKPYESEGDRASSGR